MSYVDKKIVEITKEIVEITKKISVNLKNCFLYIFFLWIVFVNISLIKYLQNEIPSDL